jgi:prepilin-type N-terminal cleavage/methylation domain-containing protein
MTYGPMVRMVRPVRPTISATGTDLPRCAGFTLIEILLVLALILLIGTLAVYNVANLSRMRDERPVDEVLLNAVREARYQAAINKELCWLSYDSEKGIFHVSMDRRASAPVTLEADSVFVALTKDEKEEKAKEQGVPASSDLKSFELFISEDEEPPKVEFFAIPPGTGFDGDPKDGPEDLKLFRVPFDPAGFSVPFQVKVDAPSEEFRATVVFDPFSNHILNGKDLK